MFAAEAWVAGKIVLQINKEVLDEFAVNKTRELNQKANVIFFFLCESAPS